MNSFNQVIVLGNVTDTPDVRETSSGQKVTAISVATNRTWKDEAGTKQEKTEFHSVVLWRGLAEIVEKYVKKGTKVQISGYLQTRSWEAQDGSKRYKTEIVAESIIMLSRPVEKKEHEEEDLPFGDENEQSSKPAKRTAKRKDDEMHIEDIPF